MNTFDFWGFSYNRSWPTIDVGKVRLETAADVVKLSFIVRKSLTYLDLSVCEYGKCEKLYFTKEAYKNNLLSQRYVFHFYHLDVAWKLDDISEFNAYVYRKCSYTECFFLKKVLVVDENVYNMDIKPYIETAVQKTNRKIRTLMKFFTLLCIQKENLSTNFIHYLKLISEEKRDSKLVCRFLKIQLHLVIHMFFLQYEQQLVDFILYHATRAKIRIFDGHTFLWRQYLAFGQYQVFYYLIKYGYNYPFFSGDFLSCLRDVAEYRIWVNAYDAKQPLWKFLSSYRRQNLFLLTVIFLLFRSNVKPIQSTDTINVFWEAIPDPFFTEVEISEGCDELQISEVKQENFLNFYKCYVSSGFLLGLTPRPLLHLCRCCVREVMGRNFQLPHGIEKLILPEKIKKYLRLNISPS